MARVLPDPHSQGLRLVALRYPNGRSRDESLAGAGVLRPGDRFDLYGRRWTAIGPVPVGRYGRDSGRTLCLSTGHTAPTAPKTGTG
jgi:hypothetical protein